MIRITKAANGIIPQWIVNSQIKSQLTNNYNNVLTTALEIANNKDSDSRRKKERQSRSKHRRDFK